MSVTRGLDHVVHAVRDLAAARRCYEGLGFTTTPPALHPWGTGNSLVQLDRSFIEILSIEQEHKIAAPSHGEFSFGQFNRQFLTRREGMSMLVFSTDDAHADLMRWRRSGVQTYAPFSFSRTATLPDGEQVRLSFSLAFATHPEMPHAGWFVCQQHDPQHFWKPQYQRHDNAAARLDCVWLQCEQPNRHAAFLASLFPDESTLEEDAHGVSLVLGYGRVALRPAAYLRERFPAMALPPGDAGPEFAALSIGRVAGAAARQECVAGLVMELL